MSWRNFGVSGAICGALCGLTRLPRVTTVSALTADDSVGAAAVESMGAAAVDSMSAAALIVVCAMPMREGIS
jgi:hypothetical protein